VNNGHEVAVKALEMHGMTTELDENIFRKRVGNARAVNAVNFLTTRIQNCRHLPDQ